MCIDNLLQEIANALQLKCLSDLKDTSHDQLRRAMRNMDKSDYSLRQWSYALTYILNKETNLEDVLDIDDLFSNPQ